ncbi:hypothetical protein KM043_011858 [Ampulex compressa]|nr:hypothetical protein KM043_011858 [Ampulex compressa]
MVRNKVQEYSKPFFRNFRKMQFNLPLIEIFISVIEEANVNSTKHFPFVALYPNIYYKSPLYEIVYISQMAATIICGLIILATDTFIATALFHTCGHFKILQENLANLDMHISYIHRIYKEQRHSSELLKKAKYEMRDIIKHHHVALWFCGNMEKNFNPILLLQVLASSLIICLVGLQVTTTLENQSKLIQYFSYLLMALFQLLLFCFPGDLLIQQSSNVSNAAYSIQWYKLPNPMRQDVQLLIMRSQKPSCITAGKFYTMHLENFSSVLSTALSYFTMLRSIN